MGLASVAAKVRKNPIRVIIDSGAVEAIPRHPEVSDRLCRKICRGLSVPEVGRE
jgi:hypothetical protein